VRHSHGAHHARPLARLLRPLHAGRQLVFEVVGRHTVAAHHVAGHADRPEVALHARHERRRRARRVGHLAVHAVSLREFENKPI